MSATVQNKSLPIYAWFVTAYNILVIAWGAMVRATGSGAGCGSHWPQCNGAIIPEMAQIETVIEFGHRISSTLAGIFVILLVYWVYRRSQNKTMRRVAAGSLVFVILEGLLGALLVRLELVAGNASLLRAGMVALHLVNTLLLLSLLGWTAWFSMLKPDSAQPLPQSRWLPLLLTVGLIATALLSAAGAVTALGDTLFPASSLVAGLNTDLDPSASFLVRLRVVHPFIAVVTSAYLLAISQYMRNTFTSWKIVRLVNALTVLIVIQLGAGVLNVILLAPLWMQVVHLVLADCVWLTLILIVAEILWKPASQVPQHISVAS